MTRNEMFKSYLDQLPAWLKVAKLQEIKERCQISHAIYLNWRLGRTPIKKPYMDLIEEILEVNLEEFFNQDNKSNE